jgi:hypothetical protein
VDNRSLWVGTLKRRTPSSMEDRPNSTYVFTAVSSEVKRMVMGGPDQR